MTTQLYTKIDVVGNILLWISLIVLFIPAFTDCSTYCQNIQVLAGIGIFTGSLLVWAATSVHRHARFRTVKLASAVAFAFVSGVAVGYGNQQRIMLLIGILVVILGIWKYLKAQVPEEEAIHKESILPKSVLISGIINALLYILPVIVFTPLLGWCMGSSCMQMATTLVGAFVATALILISLHISNSKETLKPLWVVIISNIGLSILLVSVQFGLYIAAIPLLFIIAPILALRNETKNSI